MRRRNVLAAGVACTGAVFLSQVPVAAAPRADWSLDDKLLASVPTMMKKQALPGLALAITEGGRVVQIASFGKTSVATGEPVTSATMFEAASLSKPVFAYVVLKLAEEGVLDLDRPLVESVRPQAFPDHAFIDRITARHVLTHTSGLPNWRDEVGGDLIPAREPGTAWRYSGEGFFWLQRVVEAVTGCGLEALMQARLLGPAGLEASTFSWTPRRAVFQTYGHRVGRDGLPFVSPLQLRRELGPRYEVVARHWEQPVAEWTYEDVRRVLGVMPPHTHPELTDLPLSAIRVPRQAFPNAAGSLATTVEDYARFITLMMPQEGVASWQLSEAGRRSMLARQITKDPAALGWGLGWGLESTERGQVFYHSGNNGGIFRSFVLGDANRRQALVIFTNGSRGHHVVEALVPRITGRNFISAEA